LVLASILSSYLGIFSSAEERILVLGTVHWNAPWTWTQTW